VPADPRAQREREHRQRGPERAPRPAPARSLHALHPFAFEEQILDRLIVGRQRFLFGGRRERQLAHRYLGKEMGDAYVASTAARRDAEPNIRVRIRPERWLSVDYRKAVP